MATDVLIVDDEPEVRDAIAAILGDEGYDVRHAADGRAALAEIDAEPPGVMLLDIWLEGSSWTVSRCSTRSGAAIPTCR